MDQKQLILILIAIGLFLLLFSIFVIVDYLKKPFSYPLISIIIDISGRRRPSYEECIDQWILAHQTYDIYKNYTDKIAEWDNACNDYLRRTLLWRKHKNRLYQEMKEIVNKNDYCMFEFRFVRKQTRYRQRNYIREPYRVYQLENVLHLTLLQMMAIDDELEEIDYETTRQKYYEKNQRKLMTKELRRRVMIRDNFTCQICGKYMPDEVGLHVDHIVAIRNGGKTVDSNLQVLCDKCNLSKGAKRRI